MARNGKHRQNTGPKRKAAKKPAAAKKDRRENLRPPWQPGESGNPRGRPRGTSITARLRKILDGDVDGRNVADALAKAGVQAALRGDFRFWKEILDRIDGRVIATAEDPLHVRVVIGEDRVPQTYDDLFGGNNGSSDQAESGSPE